jgi:hypothetical protein
MHFDENRPSCPLRPPQASASGWSLFSRSKMKEGQNRKNRPFHRGKSHSENSKIALFIGEKDLSKRNLDYLV